MPPKTYAWISIWFVLTAPLMLWDAGYCLMRPRSMVGGDLHWIWKFYELYEKVDYVYGVKAFENGEGFAGAAAAKAVLNVLEISMNLIYLYLAHVRVSDVAPLFGYTGAVMTLAKTILYMSQEYFCSGCSVGHNDLLVAFFFWIMPNVVWITFCSLIIKRLGHDIISHIKTSSQLKAQ